MARRYTRLGQYLSAAVCTDMTIRVEMCYVSRLSLHTEDEECR
jgi:hypothetical protein